MRALLRIGLLASLAAVLGTPLESQSPAATERCVELWRRAPDPDASLLEPPVQEHLAASRRETLASLTTAATSSADRARAVASLAEIYHAYGLGLAADAMYAVARCLDPGQPAWAYAQGRIAESRGDLERAEGLYFESLRPGSEYPAQFRLAEVARIRGDQVRAELLYREALEAPSSRAAALAALGQIALAQGEHEAAVEYLEGALAAVPEAALLHYPLSLAYRRLGNLEEARRHLALRGPVGVAPADPLDRRLEEIPRGARILVLQGRAALRADRIPEAVAALEDAVAQDPSNTSARVALAVASSRAGDRERAKRELEVVLEIAPENPVALFNLAVLSLEDGDREQARALLERALALRPDDEEMQRLLTRLDEED
jgi:tetratricopeptide (TPR) repeat protein